MEKVMQILESGRFNGQVEIKVNGRHTNLDGKTESISGTFELNFNEFSWSSNKERQHPARSHRFNK